MSAYVLDMNGLQLFDVDGAAAPPAPGPARVVDGLKAGDYEVHGTGPFICGAVDSDSNGPIVSDKRCVFGDFTRPRPLRWGGGTFGISALGGSSIVVTVIPILWGPR
jgi:hypothetical protein